MKPCLKPEAWLESHWRQRHFHLDWDGKEKGTVQKAKTKWGDAELSETAADSSGVMAKRRGGELLCIPHQPCTTDPLPLWAGAEPGRRGRQHQQSNTDSPPAFLLQPHDILIKKLVL